MGFFPSPVAGLPKHRQRLLVVPYGDPSIALAQTVAAKLAQASALLLPVAASPGRSQSCFKNSQVVNRVQKVLEGANIKLSSVASNVVGISGRAMLEALIAGVEDPQALADLVRGSLRRKRQALESALRWLVGPHQRMMLTSLLRHLDFLDEEIDQMDQEIAKRMCPYEETLQRLDTIPGVGRRAAEEIVAEIGADMSRFPTAGHLASWAHMCPGNNESAGKRRKGSTGSGNSWLRSALVEVSWAAARTRQTCLSAQYHRVAARRGGKRAVIAVDHTILVIIYNILRKGTVYQELRGKYFDERDQQSAVRRAVSRIERLGYKVTVEAA